MKKQLQKNLCVLFGLGLTVSLNAQTTLTLRPDAVAGNDAVITDLSPSTNYGTDTEFSSIAWTNGGTPVTGRSLINFNLTSIPAGATVSSAYLSLYAFNSPGNGSHSTTSGSNQSVLQRIVTSWTENTVTWANQPSVTNQNQVLLAASTSSVENYLNIDVKNLIQDMVSNPSTGYGLMFQLVTEQYYRRMVFGSSDNADSTLRPKLVVVYAVTTGIQEAISNKLEFNLYPNPAGQTVQLALNQETDLPVSLEISNSLGQLVDKRDHIKSTEPVDVSMLSKGLYFVRISDTKNSSIKKLVIE